MKIQYSSNSPFEIIEGGERSAYTFIIKSVALDLKDVLLPKKKSTDSVFYLETFLSWE